MIKTTIIAIRYTIVTTVLVGIIYPLVVTGLAQVTMRDKANGQLIEKDGHVIGSAIIAQAFTGDGYFHPRPSAAGNGYDATASGASNLGPTNPDLQKAVQGRIDALKAADPGNTAPIPVDLITASGSGLDPHISPAAALYQARRVAKARGLSEDAVRNLIETNTEGRQFGFLGEPRVNVLKLNLALDALKG